MKLGVGDIPRFPRRGKRGRAFRGLSPFASHV
jgi:hypothetical protein